MKSRILIYDNFSSLVILLLSIIAYYISFSLGLRHGGDTINYIEQIPVRTKGFGIYLNLMHYLQHTFNFPDAVFVFFHIAIAAIAIWYLIKVLNEIGFVKNTISEFVVIILVYSPYFQKFLFGKDAYIQNYLMTECLAYPLFIVSIAQLIKLVFNLIFNLKINPYGLIKANLILTLLITVRPQFYFLLLFFGVVNTFFIINNLSGHFKYLLYIAISFVIALFANPILHYIYHGNTPKPNFITDQVLTNILFYSKLSDTLAITDIYSRHRFENLIRKVERDSLSYYTKSKYNNDKYNIICHQILEKDTLMVLSDNQIAIHKINAYNNFPVNDIPINEYILNWNRNSLKLCKEILSSGYLLSRHFKNYFFHFFSIPVAKKDLLDQKISYWYFISYFVLLLLFIISVIRSTQINDTVVLMVVFIAHISNRALVVLLEPLLHRYTFYTELILLSLLIIILMNQIVRLASDVFKGRKPKISSSAFWI